MPREIQIIKKEEAYSYDELAFLEEKLLPGVADKNLQTALSEKFKNLMASLQNQKSSMAIFFMPKTSFNIFALIQGDNSICQISKEEIQALYKAFDFIAEKDLEPIHAHLQKKIKVLKDYLQAGNEVSPLPIQADNFSSMEIL
ncbi:MAG: hypothetical protein K5866_00790 [Treponema sp.]|nr:hypothetical protein [Treponema sp.]